MKIKLIIATIFFSSALFASNSSKATQNWKVLSSIKVEVSHHHTDIKQIFFSNDGGLLFVISKSSKLLSAFDAINGVLRYKLESSRNIEDIKFSQKQDRALIKSEYDSKVVVFNFNSGLKLFEIKNESNDNTINSVEFSPDGLLILTGNRNGDVSLYDSKNGNRLLTFDGHRNAVNSARFNHDGTKVVTSHNDGNVNVYQVSTGKLISSFQVSKKSVTSAAYSPDSNYILTLDNDNKTRIIDLSTNTLNYRWYNCGHQPQFIYEAQALCVGPWPLDNVGVFASYFDIISGKEIGSFDALDDPSTPDSNYFRTAINDKRKLLAVSEYDVTYVYELQKNNVFKNTFERYPFSKTGVFHFSPDGDSFIASNSGKLYFYSHTKFNKFEHVQTMIEHGDTYVTNLAFSSDSSKFASSTYGNNIILWTKK